MQFPIDVLYHGSSNKNINILFPVKDNVEEEPVVFATQSLKLASCFMIKWNDSWANLTISRDYIDQSKFDVIFVISDKLKFYEEDQGGSICVVPSHNFKFDRNKGLGVYEWTNPNCVKPLLQFDFDLALEAMKTLGVKVRFINSEQFEHYSSLSDEDRLHFLKRIG